MALLQISEPGLSGEPHKHNYALGIDLGTTNSLVACVLSGEAKILSDTDGSKLIPSVVYYEKDRVLVGSLAKDKYLTNPETTIVSIKRMIGRSLSSVLHNNLTSYDFLSESPIPKINTLQGYKSPVEISAAILAKLSDIANIYLDEPPVGAVITVPAYFDENQRQATKQAAQLAKLPVLRLLSEPTAAAIAYGLDNTKQGKFIIYDLGGGTFDVSILELHDGVFEVLAVNGEAQLGGDDFDHLLYDYILQQSHINELSNTDKATMLSMAKKLKEQLSYDDSVVCDLELSNKHHIKLSITQIEFRELTHILVDKTISLLRKALRDAKLSLTDIDDIVLVGGSTRMPIVKDAISKLLGKPALDHLNPDEVVAIGAAIQANILAGNSKEDWLLLDVTPLSLGIETMGGLVEVVIPRNSAIPTKMAQDFTTHQDGQTAMSIHVVQGERDKVEQCISLAKFSLKNIPAMIAGAAKIRVTYQIDADGLLSVSAEELVSGVVSSLEVKPSSNLSDTQIIEILQDSVLSAQDDINYRKWAELQIDIRALITNLERNMINYTQLLTNDDIVLFNEYIHKLNNLIEITEYNEVNYNTSKKHYDKLNNFTSNFASKIMDEAIKSSFAGKQIDQVKEDLGI